MIMWSLFIGLGYTKASMFYPLACPYSHWFPLGTLPLGHNNEHSQHGITSINDFSLPDREVCS